MKKLQRKPNRWRDDDEYSANSLGVCFSKKILEAVLSRKLSSALVNCHDTFEDINCCVVCNELWASVRVRFQVDLRSHFQFNRTEESGSMTITWWSGAEKVQPKE
uniref:DNA-directed RNA polymerase n=1 Tax=Steinernema glaseri TaxID=37863 RepID=A0A1I7ZDV3_9BILA